MVISPSSVFICICFVLCFFMYAESFGSGKSCFSVVLVHKLFPT